MFVVDKKQLDGFSRHDRDLILDVLKKGVSQLTRLRHPKILSVLHPLEESRSLSLIDLHPISLRDNIMASLSDIKFDIFISIESKCLNFADL